MPFSIPFLSLQRVLLLNSFPGLDMLLTSKFLLSKSKAFSPFLPSLLFYPIFYHIFGPCSISPWLRLPLALIMDPPKLQPSLSHAPPSGFVQVPQLRTRKVGLPHLAPFLHLVFSRCLSWVLLGYELHPFACVPRSTGYGSDTMTLSCSCCKHSSSSRAVCCSSYAWVTTMPYLVQWNQVGLFLLSSAPSRVPFRSADRSGECLSPAAYLGRHALTLQLVGPLLLHPHPTLH